MEKREYPFIIGTAGHIDHGKTSLVKALSGVDTDRLLEEKRRGMTIELGFAPLKLPSGKTVSIIDVPGHEKFIRQMVAGAAGVDAVMLTVAADDGVMPQTREHLEILSLLNIQDGITVINKIDLADEEMRELVYEETRELLLGTFLEGKQIVCASAITGEGIAELAAAIDIIVDKTARRKRDGGFFMPIDRVFHMSGFGTVITGTAIKGVLSADDDIEILPVGANANIRSMQVHNSQVETVCAGNRAAINLSGVSLENVRRGDIVAAKGYYSVTQCIDACLKIPASFSDAIRHWQRVKLHIGTSEALARISFLDREKLLPGESASIQILPETAICTYSGANFIIRSYSPVNTIGGGEVLLSLDERPKNKNARTALLRLLASLGEAGDDLAKRLTALLEYKGTVREAYFMKLAETDMRKFSAAVSSLESKEKIRVFRTPERHFFSQTKTEEIKKRLLELLARFHAENPERKGMEAEEIARLVSLPDARVAKDMLRVFAAKQWISLDGERARLNDFRPFDEDKFSRQLEVLRELARKKGYAMPTIDEAMEVLHVGAKEMNRVLAYLKDNKEAVILSGEFIVFSFIEKDFMAKLLTLPNDNITLAGVRDATNSSRKYILPLLERFDSKGISRRVGDKRILFKKTP